MFVSATHLTSCPNFSITGELLTYSWGKIGAQGYMSLGIMSKGNMTLPPTFNVKTYSMFVSATNLMFCPNYSFTLQLLTYLWGEIGAQEYMSLGVTLRGNLNLAPRCNAKIYSMFVSTTHLTSWPNFSITDELLTYLWVKNRCTGVHELGVMSRGNMTLAPRCNTKSYSMFISDTHLTSCPNSSITDELLTYLWGEIGAQGYMSWVLCQGVTWLEHPDVMLKPITWL